MIPHFTPLLGSWLMSDRVCDALSVIGLVVLFYLWENAQETGLIDGCPVILVAISRLEMSTPHVGITCCPSAPWYDSLEGWRYKKDHTF